MNKTELITKIEAERNREDVRSVNMVIEKEDFTDQDLSYMNLKNIEFIECDFKRANLTGSSISECVFKGVAMIDANFTRVTVSKTKIDNVVFRSTKFDGCTIEDSDISRCRSEAIKMHASLIKRSSIVNSSIKWSDVCGVSLADTNIYKCYVEGLTGTYLKFEENMQVSNSNFTNLRLIHSAFADTEMMGKKNRLSNAYFVDTFFNDVNFAGASFKNVTFVHSPVFQVDIHGVDNKEVLIIDEPVAYNILIGDNAGKSKVRAKLRLKLPGAAYDINDDVLLTFNKNAVYVYDADYFESVFIEWVKNYAGNLGAKGVTAWIDIAQD